MPLVSLDLAIKHCRAEPGVEDDLITLYLAAAESAARKYLNRQVFETKADMDVAVAASTAGDFPIVVDSDHKAAILLICAHLYANREDVVTGTAVAEMPRDACSFLRPDRISPGV